MLKKTKFAVLLVLLAAASCASRTNRVYPDNGMVTYFDTNAGSIGGNLDTTGVQMHYRGPLKDSIEDIKLLEASATWKKGGRKAALRELQLQAQKLNAEGIYDVQYKDDSSGSEASGIAFRFRR